MKETVDSHELQRELNIAKSMLILSNYAWLKEEADKLGIEIIPLKGIDLLRTLYADSLDRPVTDIDIYVKGEKEALKLCNHLCKEDYRPEFPFSLRPEVLSSKHKISLIACCRGKVNIDVHTAFVTKKFFINTIRDFNTDAYKRCNASGMEDKDKWLFLAQHAAFHNWSNPKWLRDLELLYHELPADGQIELANRAEKYGMRRVFLATMNLLNDVSKGDFTHDIKISKKENRFLRYIKKNRRPMKRTLNDRVITAYWEFLFISDKVDRIKMKKRLFWPDKGTLANIYRVKNERWLSVYYPLNCLITSVTSLIFGIDYVRRIMF